METGRRNMEAESGRLKGLFLAALERPRAERGAFVRASCGEDEALRTQLETMLRAHERASEFLETPIARWRATLHRDDEIPA